MHVPAGPLDQPVTDQLGLMRGIVVPHQVHIEIGWHTCLNLIEVLAKFLSTIPRVALADHLAGGDIERGKQRCCAVTRIVMAAPLRLSRPQVLTNRQPWDSRIDALMKFRLGTLACLHTAAA